MRLIDAEPLRKKIRYECGLDCWGRISEVDVLTKIDIAPTIDAVPVVRCRDCRYRFASSCPMFHEEQTYNDDYGYYWIDHDYTHDDGFCDEGKPKDGEADD